MNKLCSRNTALATAAGRSGCAPIVSRPLVVFSPFDILVRFILSFALFVFLPPLSFSLFRFNIPLRYVRECPSLTIVDARIGVSLLSSSLSFSQTYFFFILNCVPANLRRVFAISLAVFFFVSVNDPGVSLRPHSSRDLYLSRGELHRELQPRRVRARTEFPARSSVRVGMPATEQISNK